MPAVTIGVSWKLFNRIQEYAKTHKLHYGKALDAILAEAENRVCEPASKVLIPPDAPLYDDQQYTGAEIKTWLRDNGYMEKEASNG